MRCLVTAGPTYEPLDRVRRLTNHSTGRLGSELATYLANQGHEVTLLLGELASAPRPTGRVQVETFSTTGSLRELLREKSERGAEALFHVAAVSDFTFGKLWRKTRDGELLEVKGGKVSTREGVLMAELTPTPKIIAEIRQWLPQARLIGWKYEVDGNRASVLRLAEKQIAECLTDACVANGPAYGEGFGLVRQGGEVAHLAGSAELFPALEELLRE